MYSAGMFAARTMLLATLLFAVAGLPSAALAQNCMSGQQARQLLEQGQVVPFPEAIRRAGISRDELAGDPQLCESGGGPVYKVRVYKDGQLTAVSIPAN